MGCGGSKQQDVATGNTVSTGKLSQKEVAASKSKASSSTTSTDVGSADESLKSIVEKAEMAETNGGLQGNEKPTTSMVVEVTEEEQLTTKAQEDGMEKELKEIETKAQEEEKEEVGLKDDDGMHDYKLYIYRQMYLKKMETKGVTASINHQTLLTKNEKQESSKDNIFTNTKDIQLKRTDKTNIFIN